MPGDITSANSVLTLAQAVLFPQGPQQIQGFASDDIFDVDQIQAGEAIMGVDGRLSGGFVFVPVPQNYTLQADSESVGVFDTIWRQEQAAKTKYRLTGVILLPSISKKWTMTGGLLTLWKPVPDGKKVLQPQKFQITWERLLPAPI